MSSIGPLLRSFIPQIISNTSFSSGPSFDNGFPGFSSGRSNSLTSFNSPFGGGRSNSSSSMLLMFMFMILLDGFGLGSSQGGVRPRSLPAKPTVKPTEKPTHKGEFHGAVTAKELYKLSQKDDDVVIVDVRDKASFDKGHAKGAINLPKDQWAGHKFKEGEKPYFMCYSKTCTLGEKAAKYFADKGYDTWDMEGGYPAWPAAGLPTEKA